MGTRQTAGIPVKSGSTASLETALLPGWKGEKWLQIFYIARFVRGCAFLFPTKK
jgi:hypothetical protein